MLAAYSCLAVPCVQMYVGYGFTEGRDKSHRFSYRAIRQSDEVCQRNMSRVPEQFPRSPRRSQRCHHARLARAPPFPILTRAPPVTYHSPFLLAGPLIRPPLFSCTRQRHSTGKSTPSQDSSVISGSAAHVLAGTRGPVRPRPVSSRFPPGTGVRGARVSTTAPEPPVRVSHGL